MTAEESAATALAIDDKSRVTMRRGLFVGVDANMKAIVTLGASRIAVDFVSGLIPEPNEVVHVWSIDDQVVMAGPVRPKPGQGKVAAIVGSKLTVTTVIGDLAMPYIGAAPAVNDIVAIGWSEGPVALGKLSTSTPPPPTPGGGTGQTVYSAVFYPTDTGSTDRGAVRWWTDQPWASNTTYGAWFYGWQLKDTIPAAATLESLEFYASYIQDQGAAPNFALHDQAIKSTLPTFTGTTVWDVASGWQTPPDPTGWFNALKQGGASFGIGLNQGGFNKFASRSQDGLSGALRITWKV